MYSTNSFFVLLIATLSFAACRSDHPGKDIPDVSDIPVTVDLKRFDQDLFALDTNSIGAGLATLESRYGEFAQLYFGQVLGSKDARIAPEGHEEYVRGFISHPAVRNLYDTTQVVFPDMKKLEKDFAQAFKYFKYHFPEQPLSGEVVAYISEYTIGGFVYGDNSIGVGLDFYLGQNFPYQHYNPANPNFSAYLIRTFNSDHLVMKSMKLLVQDLLGPANGHALLDLMVHNGKELYLLSHLLPNMPDSVILEYSQPQVDWVKENEANIWAYFISENMLYSSELGKYRKYLEYSPNSPGMPNEAPGRTANWLGLQIVKAYMAKKPGTSLQQLIEIKEAQTILEEGRYKPKR